MNEKKKAPKLHVVVKQRTPEMKRAVDALCNKTTHAVENCKSAAEGSTNVPSNPWVVSGGLRSGS